MTTPQERARKLVDEHGTTFAEDLRRRRTTSTARIGAMTLPSVGDWTWGEQTYEILGFREGDVPATSAVLMSHVHPDSRVQAQRLFDPATRGATAGR